MTWVFWKHSLLLASLLLSSTFGVFGEVKASDDDEEYKWGKVPKNCQHLNQGYSQADLRICMRIEQEKYLKSKDIDCAECFHDQPEEESSALVDTLSVLAQPIAYLAAAYTSNKYNYKSNKAWAEAYETGHKECTSRFNSYLDYNTSVGANPMLPADAAALNMSCNGNPYSAYAGFGGYYGNGYGGYYNPYMSAGWSSGFLNGYYGGGATGYYGMNNYNGMGIYNPFGQSSGLGGSFGLNFSYGLNTSGNVFQTSTINDSFSVGN